MNECLNKLVGLKSVCETSNPEPYFYLDDVEGLTEGRLSQLATERDGNGKLLFDFLKGSAIRLMLADIDSVIPSNYKIKQELSSVCSSCSFSGFFSQAVESGTGIIVKNMSNSRFTSLIIDSLKIKIANTGTFNLIVGDKVVTQDFVADEELTIQNIGYETSEQTVKIYFSDPTVKLYSITCPANSSCGCGGSSKTMATDIVITGMTQGIEGVTQYGILPCVKIRCSYDQIICDLVDASPRIFGLALLYLMASKSFEENVLSQRVNRTASFDKEDKKDLSEYYFTLYRERITGNPKKQIVGIAGVVNSNLKLIKDKCVSCDSPNGVAWAVG